jgi:integrase
LRDAAEIFLETGMRPSSEVMGLRVKDIGLDRLTVHVTYRERGTSTADLGKTPGADRIVPLSSRAAEILRRRIERLNSAVREDFIFPTQNGHGHQRAMPAM